jgi:hypothetical protein
MSKYLLKLSGSNEILNIIQWSGSNDFTPPSGYVIEPFVTESLHFINKISVVDSPYIEPTQSINLDILINNDYNIEYNDTKDIQISDAIETAFGDLKLQPICESGSFLFPGAFAFENDNKLLMSRTNLDQSKQLTYFASISSLINNDRPNNIIKFINRNKPNTQIHFMITGSMSGSIKTNPQITENLKYTEFANFLKFDGFITKNSLFTTFSTSSALINELSSSYEEFILKDDIWMVDIQSINDVQSGTFFGNHIGDALLDNAKINNLDVTGSVDITGSLILNGVDLGELAKLDGTASNSVYAQTASFTDNASTIEVITSTQFWTKPSWAKTIRVTLVGGGGGGGSAPATEDQFYLIGGGGGGGGTVTIAEYDADTLDESIWVFVGAGGSGGTNLTLASNGGSSMFGNLLVARGGNAGQNGKIEFGPGSLGWGFVQGGTSIGKIDYINTGGGGGGAGTINGIIPGLIENAAYASLAPTLPIIDSWLDLPDRGDPTLNYYTTWPIPIPASIAPTGGGGGTGYDPSNGRQNANTFGGTIIGWLPYGLRYEDVLTAYTYYGGSLPAFNSKIGIGGNGGNAYDLSRPTHGEDYGGGGGGAYAGGLISGSGVYPDGTPTYTDYNFGANGANGIVVIISEA